jgi:hypothetical protein
MFRNRFIGFRSQIMNRKRPDGLIGIYFTLIFLGVGEGSAAKYKNEMQIYNPH